MENQKPEQGMNIHLTKTEIKTIQEALIVYYKIRAFEWLPYFEKCEARKAIPNYYEIMHQIDDLETKMDDFLEKLDKAKNS